MDLELDDLLVQAWSGLKTWTPVVLRLAWKSIAGLFRFVFHAFLPIIYTIYYLLVPLRWHFKLLRPLIEPFYIFFGCATFLGTIVGATLLLSSWGSRDIIKLEEVQEDIHNGDLAAIDHELAREVPVLVG